MKIATLLFVLVAANGATAKHEPVLLDFQATWCGPCRQMRPVVEQLVDQGYPVKQVDVDQSPQLAAKYQIEHVPTFVVIDPSTGRALARMEGACPAADLVNLYREAKAKLPARRVKPRVEAPDEDGEEAGDEKPAPPPRVNPNPWETVVRIKIDGHGLVGFGSGTIIHSTPKEAIILTCAHIFKLEGRRQAHPSEFPNRIMIDLFDGQLRGQQVHYAQESYPGQAIDYDFDLDVGLIRIRPGRRLPSSRVVPAHWQPLERMKMITVGCSEGHDATAWSTLIMNPGLHARIQGHRAYEAIECLHAPKQGRSGGGLYTEDGYVAGVCDFAEPQGNHGLYATPRSIYRILDRNNLMALYAPSTRPGQLLAGNAPTTRSQAPRTRAQSPELERDEAEYTRSGRQLARTGPAARTRAPSPEGASDEADLVTIPPPGMLGIATPDSATTRIAQSSPRARNRRTGWMPPKTTAPAADDTELTDLKLSPEADSDQFASLPNAGTPATAENEPEESVKPQSSSKWHPARTKAFAAGDR